MANFRTHVATSAILGGAAATAAHLQFGIPLPSAAIAGGLFTLGGVLPDMDSDNGVIFRESLGVTAAVVPILMLDHFAKWQLPRETLSLTIASIYLGIRFGVGSILRTISVHRGMWHSIPAAVLAGLLVYGVCAYQPQTIRFFKMGSIIAGYLWHLILDEVYAVEPRFGGVRLKKSFGTALKFWGDNPIANLWVYGLVVAAAFLIQRSDHPLPVPSSISQPPRIEYTPQPPYSAPYDYRP
jgi:membrane-bound metal-dependent hydrolase YbcI (DUF457 family)